MYPAYGVDKFQDKHLWVKKATGLGITEFMLRIMGWLCTSGSYALWEQPADVHSHGP